jgi:hypothetical protein
MTKQQEYEDTYKETIRIALNLSPYEFLKRQFGNEAKLYSKGNSVHVKDVIRTDYRPNKGGWIACDWYGGGIGNNISLVKHLMPGLGFKEIINELLGNDPITELKERIMVTKTIDPNKEFLRPKIPTNTGHIKGREYLSGRGISTKTILFAEEYGVLQYCSSGVIFLGRDQNKEDKEIKSATIRYYELTTNKEGDIINKKDFFNSNKGHPVYIEGSDTIVIVEGGVNGLSALDIYMSKNKAHPTIVVTGGVGIRHWVTENPYIQNKLKNAEKVVIFAENEYNEDQEKQEKKQKSIDLLRDKLKEEIQLFYNGSVEIKYPPKEYKDLNDLHVGRQKILKNKDLDIINDGEQNTKEKKVINKNVFSLSLKKNKNSFSI